MEDYNANGYCILHHFFGEEEMQELQATIFEGIQQCLKELNTDESAYLSAVNRWHAPSPVTQAIDQPLMDQLSVAVAPIVGPEALCGKTNVVFKNQYANDAIPCHQDIAYNKTNPYQMSCWLAVTKVRLKDGGMYLYPQSHLWPIQRAVDFWSPDHQDRLPKILEPFLKEAITITLDRGDVLLFDSRLWHGSHKNISGQHRVAVVTRWTGKAYEPPPFIPNPDVHFFGLWTCAEQTVTILSQALGTFYQEESNNFLQLLAIWQKKLEKGEASQLVNNAEAALQALAHVRILHFASKQHHGGDSYGRVYKNLWSCLLAPLVQRMTKTSA